MAAAGAAPAAREALDRVPERAASAHHQWHPVDPAHRRALARPAGALRAGRHGVEPLLSLACLGRVGPDPGGAAGRGRGGWRDRLGPALRGCDGHPRPSARRRRPPRALSGGEAQAREALGRSQGGVSTKLHLRAEGKGRPITAVLTSGERHEQIALEALLDQGAIRRPGRGAWLATRATVAQRLATICSVGTFRW